VAASTSLTREQGIERARNAGKAAQQPETYAQKLVRDWPELSSAQKATISALLRPVVVGGVTACNDKRQPPAGQHEGSRWI
jgi:hypothetical protein